MWRHPPKKDDVRLNLGLLCPTLKQEDYFAFYRGSDFFGQIIVRKIEGTNARRSYKSDLFFTDDFSDTRLAVANALESGEPIDILYYFNTGPQAQGSSMDWDGKRLTALETRLRSEKRVRP